MEIKLRFEKGISFELNRSKESTQLKLLRIQHEQALRFKDMDPLENKSEGANYHHCTFGLPFPITIQTASHNELKGSIDDALEYTKNLTGVDKEIITRVWETMQQYFIDRNGHK
jgi:hypothetical protein